MEDSLRVARLANPALLELGPVTWQSGFRVTGYNWQPWLDDCFGPQILPLLGEALRLAGDCMGRELVTLDRAALRGLNSSARESSGRAGRLLLRHGAPAGAKVLQKLAGAVAQGESAGHLATVFAVRCGVFSISPRQMALGYLYSELRAGAPDWPDRQIAEHMEEARPLIERWLQSALGDGVSIRRWSHG